MNNLKNTLGAGILTGILSLGLSGFSHAEEGKHKPPASPVSLDAHLSSQYQAQTLRKMSVPSAAPWAPEGPWGTGRFSDVVVDPANDQIVYAASASGGIWKSTNGGVAWTQKFNDYDQSVGALAVDPNNSQTVWAGGGECMFGGGSLTYPGTGIYKSLNGGDTWQRMGLDSSFYISRIAVTPGNSNSVYAAVLGSLYGKNSYRGVYRSTDGGVNWTRALYVDDSTGATDVHVHPTVPTRIIANLFSGQRLPYGRNWGGPSSRVHLSEDGGATWRMLGAAEGLPTSDLGRSGMDIAAVNPNIMYMVYFTASNVYKAVYRTINGGLNWTQVTGPNATQQGQLYSYYAHTFSQIRVNPFDVNDVILLGIQSFRSTNAGGTWSNTLLNTHADHRTMTWSRQNANRLYLGDDGGLGLFAAGPNGTFSYQGRAANGLNISQIYSMDIAPDNAAYRYLGLQDNGTNMTANGGGSWTQIIGGDGMQTRLDYGAPVNVFGSLQYGNFSRSSNRGTGGMSGITGFPTTLSNRRLWDAGIAIDSVNGVTYIGSQFVFRAPRGSGAFSQVGNDLTNGDHSVTNYQYGCISALAAHNGVTFAGTDDGNVWVNTAANTGSTWTRIRNGTTGMPPSATGERAYNGWIKQISTDKTDPTGLTALVAVSYFRWGHRFWRPSIYRVTVPAGNPAGSVWQDITGDLPPTFNTNKVVKAANGYLYVGTDYGPYFSTNGGVNWAWLGDRNLPVVPVNDLTIHNTSNTLYIGTYGRGMWSYALNLVVPLEERDRTLGIYGKQILKNFPNPVTTSTKIQFQVNKPQNLFVAIYDLSGREVRILLNKKVESDKLYDLVWDRKDGKETKVQPGGYILRAIGDKVTMARKLTVQ